MTIEELTLKRYPIHLSYDGLVALPDGLSLAVVYDLEVDLGEVGVPVNQCPLHREMLARIYHIASSISATQEPRVRLILSWKAEPPFFGLTSEEV